ncbi:MAG: sugar phosphate nucleotidyltransferase [Nocardioidaceae bacterium]
MEAVIIAGGLGTRLLPLTEHRPKHVLPVGGVPFVVHQVAKLAAAGVDHVVLATSYHSEAFLPVLGDGSELGLSITYVREDPPLGTGGAIRYAAALLDAAPDDPVLVLNGDQLSGHDLAAQVAALHARDADVVLHLVEVPDARAYGVVPTDEDGWVTAFVEKSDDPPASQINAGGYVFRRSAIDRIPAGRVVSVERETFPGFVAAGRRVLGHRDDAYWIDVGTPALLVRASCDLVLGRVVSAAYPAVPSAALVQDGAQVAPDATVNRGSVIGPGTEIGAGALVSGSVVMPGARLGPGVELRDSVVGPGAVLGAYAVVTDAVVGDEATIGERTRLLAGASVGVGETVPADTVVRVASPRRSTGRRVR